MTKLEQIEKAAAELSTEDRAKLRAWLADFEEQLFDDAIERDAKSGRLEILKSRARANLKAGRVRDL